MKRLSIALGLIAGAVLSAPTQPTATPAGDVIEINGDFEKGDLSHPGKPLHWDPTDGLAVRWADAPAVLGAPAHGKAIRMDTLQSEEAVVASYSKAGLLQWVFPHPAKNAIAETYGVSLYSEAIPVIAGKTYKVTFDYLAEKGTAGKLWFRGYANVNGQMKRSYEGTVDAGGKRGEWQHVSGIFHPTKHTPQVSEFKIMLFAYYPPGVAWFDNIHIEAVDEPDDVDAP